jgi:hypothetical protein
MSWKSLILKAVPECCRSIVSETRPARVLVAALLMVLLMPYQVAANAIELDHRGFDRSHYANSSHAIWSNLTPFEIQVIDHFPRAQRGDADALLALFLLASGDVRFHTQYTGYKAQIDKWASEISADVNRQRSQEAKGRLLLEAMHEGFFLPQDEGDALATGYNFGQSQLSMVFASERFNCISSSLLYVVLAQKFGLSTRGGILPTHAFVQLDLDTGESIDVETTSIAGYNLVHDEDFYQQIADGWSAERELEPLSITDYRNRTIVAHYELGLHDMWTQHTSPERMAFADRMRLAEIRSLLAPEDVGAQKGRLHFYNEEYNHFIREGSYDEMKRLSTIVEPYLHALSQLSHTDVEFVNMVASIEAHLGLSWVLNGEPEKAIGLAHLLIDRLAPSLEGHETIRRTAHLIIGEFIIDAINKGTFSRARRALIGYEESCLAIDHCAEALANLYIHWVQRYERQRNWQQVMHVLDEYLAIDDLSATAENFKQYYESAFLNIAAAHVFDEDRRAAEDVLESCILRLEKTKRCQQSLTNLDATGRL